MTEKEAFGQWFRSSKYSQIALPSAGDVQRAWDSWKVACEWQRSVCNEELVMLRQRVKELGGYKAAWVETAKHRDAAERELAALKQQSEPVAWYDPTNKNPSQSVTFSKVEHDYWPHLYSVPLYAAPPTCFSAGDMADAQAKAFMDGQQS